MKIDPKWNILLESLKEPARLLILAVIAWIISAIIPQLDPMWQGVLVVLLRWADKYVYEYQKTERTVSTYKGLIGF